MKDEKNIQRVRAWQALQKEKGLCIECSNPANGLRCDTCNKRRAEKRKEKYQKWRTESKCCVCGKDALLNKNYCEQHYLMKVSHSRIGTSKHWKYLKTLIEKQNFKCALTGDKITFNDDIELDHIVPKSRGGSNKLSNFQWVTKQVNWFKGTWTENELLTMFRKIINTIG